MAIIRGTDFTDNLSGSAEGDTINAFGGNDTVHGNGGNDRLFGDAGNDRLFGDAGNDLLDGGLDQGADSDTLDGGSGIDTVSYSGLDHAISVNLVQGLALGVGNVDTLISIENITGTNSDDSLIGSLPSADSDGANLIQGGDGNDFIDGLGGNDILFGGSGNDHILGGAGNDQIVGGAGVDKLEGGADADVFKMFSTAESGVGANNRDVITDFVQGVDKLDLHAIDAKVLTSGNQDFSFIGSAAFTAEGQVRVVVEGDHTLVQMNTSGAGGAESEIQLAGHVALNAHDFVL
jgi:Ca2+-binding RTX toxin-like protein